jgi:hypothetical protein
MKARGAAERVRMERKRDGFKEVSRKKRRATTLEIAPTLRMPKGISGGQTMNFVSSPI